MPQHVQEQPLAPRMILREVTSWFGTEGVN
ncbi:hypothetical protein H4W80_010577 [Nonomuraea angiospora]|uniref:Uncharacterized protein n=1 Tax=Nonomuraea angiospora TaxID=46172 RepID=A0ABR9MHR9_9ACTN|nr:hypothetical protein [Nonomuraea angiospora]